MDVHKIQPRRAVDNVGAVEDAKQTAWKLERLQHLEAVRNAFSALAAVEHANALTRCHTWQLATKECAAIIGGRAFGGASGFDR